MKTRFGVVRKSAAATALALFVVAQPQMLCALHCMVFDDMGDMNDAAVAHTPVGTTAPSGSTSVALTANQDHPVAMSCSHGMNVITAPTLPGASVGLATVSVVERPVFGIRPAVSESGGVDAVVVTYTPRVDTPPPRV